MIFFLHRDKIYYEFLPDVINAQRYKRLLQYWVRIFVRDGTNSVMDYDSTRVGVVVVGVALIVVTLIFTTG